MFVFCVWLIWLSIISSEFLHVVACIRTSFLFMAKWYPIVWIYHILFIHSSVDGHLDCSTFWLLWIILQWILAKYVKCENCHLLKFLSILLVLTKCYLLCEEPSSSYQYPCAYVPSSRPEVVPLTWSCGLCMWALSPNQERAFVKGAWERVRLVIQGRKSEQVV